MDYKSSHLPHDLTDMRAPFRKGDWLSKDKGEHKFSQKQNSDFSVPSPEPIMSVKVMLLEILSIPRANPSKRSCYFIYKYKKDRQLIFSLIARWGWLLLTGCLCDKTITTPGRGQVKTLCQQRCTEVFTNSGKLNRRTPGSPYITSLDKMLAKRWLILKGQHFSTSCLPETFECCLL